METTKEKELEKLEVINKIKLIAEDYDLLDKYFTLECVTEGTIIYQYQDLGLIYSLEIKADNDFFKRETLDEILNTERIDFIYFRMSEMKFNNIEDIMYSKWK